jgi:hypothetical protein
MRAIETVAAQQTPSNCGTPISGGLGIALDHAKAVLQATQQFSFTDSTVDGQPVSTAILASGGSSTFSAISNGFSAQFIGDPCNLSKILIKAPYTDNQATVDQGLAAGHTVFCHHAAGCSIASRDLAGRKLHQCTCFRPETNHHREDAVHPLSNPGRKSPPQRFGGDFSS